jgi:hypothetical protein
LPVSNSVKATFSPKPERSAIWQQIGNSIANAAAMRLPCEQVRRRRKWFQISGFPTSTQCHADATRKQGIQVRILVPQLS